MTAARTCLRCDWQGGTDASACPDCGAPLYELGKTIAGGNAPPAPAPAPSRRPSTPPPPAAHEAAEPTRTRSRSLVAIVISVVVLAAAVGAWLNAHEAPTGAAAAPTTPQIGSPPLTGTLVYAVPDGAGRSRLWRYRFETGTAVPGPRVARAIELVDARSVNPGWLGLTSELPDGSVQASILHSVRADARPSLLVRGDVVSWGPRGSTVIAGRRGALGTGCRRPVSIVWARLDPPMRERVYDDPSLCGDLLSIGLDNLSTMFTLERHGRIGIFFAGIGRIHEVLDGYAMVAVSALSDLVVVPQASFDSLRPLPARPEQERPDLRGAGLYFEGSGEGRPLPYGVGSDPFAIARVLAWSPDGVSALVVGSQGFRRGFYLLDTAAGDGLDAPRYVGPTSGIPYGTMTFDGVVIVETADGSFSWSGGDLRPIATAPGAPPPDGPIVWIP